MPTQKDIYNPSGSTPEEMNRQAFLQMQNRVEGQSAAAPGTLVTGAQTGATTPGQIAQTPITFQAYTSTDASRKAADLATLPPIAEKAVDGAGDSSLTSSPAKTYVTDVGKTVSDRQKQISADALASDQKLADLNRILGQQSSNLIANQLKAAEAAQKPLKEQFAITAEQTAASRKEAEATQQAAAFRMQQTATPYAEAATAKRARAYELEDKQRGMREKELLDQAWDRALGGEIAISQRLLGEAQTAMQERQRIRDDARAEQEMTMKLAEYEDTRALKAQDRAMSTIGNLVSAGFTVDQLPKMYLHELDAQSGMPEGFSSQIFQTTKSAQEAQAVQDVEERRSKELDNASKLVTILDKVPSGQAVQIGDATYYGTSRGDVKSGTEIDANGNGTYWEFDPVTKQVQTHSLGAIGKAQDGWETETDDQGRMWFVNPRTKQTQPAFPSEGQKALEDIIPDGAVWQRNGVDAPECGQFVNDLTGAGVGDSYESKLAKVDQSIKAGTDNPPRYGDFFVQSTSTWTGHTGIVVGSEIAPDGETYIFTKESNYPKSGVINSRRIKASEVAGFGRTGNLAPGLQVGSDKPTFGKKDFSVSTPGVLDEKAKSELANMDERSKLLWTNTSDSDRDIARQLVNGDMLLSEASARAVGKSPDSEKMRLNKLALTLDPTFSPIKNKQRADFKTSWNNPNQRPYNIRVSGNTALSHLAELKHWTDQLQNTDFMKANSLKNAIDKNINKPQLAEAIQNFDYTAELLAHEIAAFYKGNASPTDQDVAQQRDKINNMKPNDILNSLINLQVNTMGAKIVEQGVEYKKVMGKYPDDSIVDPNAITNLKAVGVDTSRLEKLMSEQTNSKVINLKGPDGQIYPYDLSDPELKNEYEEALKNGFTKQ